MPHFSSVIRTLQVKLPPDVTEGYFGRLDIVNREGRNRQCRIDKGRTMLDVGTVLHGCTVGDGSLIGIHAVLLNGAVIGTECLVGAGAVVTERKQFEAGSLILGAPAKVVRMLTSAERVAILGNARTYVQRASDYKNGLATMDADVLQG
jgi:carbonic anhydrase/acetyltransferase-like protein (isoleucine patch superfamily)